MEQKIKQVFNRFPKLTKVYVNLKTKEVKVSRKAGFKILYKKDFLQNQRSNKSEKSKENKQ